MAASIGSLLVNLLHTGNPRMSELVRNGASAAQGCTAVAQDESGYRVGARRRCGSDCGNLQHGPSLLEVRPISGFRKGLTRDVVVPVCVGLSANALFYVLSRLI